ncbi:MAG TPA: hypothetical protein VMB80_08445 [Candidatus Acidoferrum sp.]|nr:hypothetical protein [Candidatus Acidoferrum sp.]
MDTLAPNLEIRLYATDGSVERFRQNEAIPVKRKLNEFQPDQVFTRQKIIIVGRDSLTSVPTRQVVRLDLVSNPPERWIFPSEIADTVELTGAEFQALHQNLERGDPRRPAQGLEGAVASLLEVEMAGQQPLFLALETAPEPPLDRPEAILCPLYPLTLPGLCFRLRTGGVAALNLFHLMRFTLYPAPPQTPIGAWPAQRGSNRRQGLYASEVREPRYDRRRSFPAPPKVQMHSERPRRNANENSSTSERKH